MTTHITLVDYHNAQHTNDMMQLMDEYVMMPIIHGSPLPDYARENLTATLATVPGAFTIIAYVDKQPAALTNCFQGFSTFKCQPLINVHDVMVSANYRSRGLTRLMLNEVEKIAYERNCCKLTLEVLEGNPVAQRAYRHLGFENYAQDEFGIAQFWEKALTPKTDH